MIKECVVSQDMPERELRFKIRRLKQLGWKLIAVNPDHYRPGFNRMQWQPSLQYHQWKRANP